MAKKAKKIGRPRKKRKYTRKDVDKVLNEVRETKAATDKFQQFNPNGGDLGRGTADCVKEEPIEAIRAHKDSYMFVGNCKVLLRNLNDIALIEEATKLRTRIFELRNQLDTFERVLWNMNREKEFRGL